MAFKSNQRRNKADPTGEARQRRKGTAELNRRINAAARLIAAEVRAIPRTSRTVKPLKVNQVVYDWAVDPLLLEQGIHDAVNSNLETSSETKPTSFYWDEIIEQPYRKGTLETARDNEGLAEELGLAILLLELETVTTGFRYIQRLQTVQGVNYGLIKSMSSNIATDFFTTLRLGMEAGESPSEIMKRIRESARRARRGVRGAKQFAETEINKALNDAKIDLTEQIEQDTGQSMALLHISALIPTTRPHHAARHGKTYTPQAQRIWWNEGQNRRNCHCTVRSVQVDDDGVPTVPTKLRRQLAVERKDFLEVHD